MPACSFDVWALDFAGYGASDRYPEMRDPANAHGPLGRADAGSRQIAEAVRFVCARQGVSGLSLVAHSWGTLPASLYATETPASINRLVLFGPVTHDVTVTVGARLRLRTIVTPIKK
jgi:pimeloyl-ACP methyl ester carboxylesterase